MLMNRDHGLAKNLYYRGLDESGTCILFIRALCQSWSQESINEHPQIADERSYKASRANEIN